MTARLTLWRALAHRPVPAPRWVYDDGGRAAAGHHGPAGDCGVRAIAIATQLSYQHVYDGFNDFLRRGHYAGSARYGSLRPIYQRYLADLGWTWRPTMAIGSGCTVHLTPGELPPGRIVTRLSKHLCAVVDGVVYDDHDPTRGGNRCVYGIFLPPEHR